MTLNFELAVFPKIQLSLRNPSRGLSFKNLYKLWEAAKLSFFLNERVWWGGG